MPDETILEDAKSSLQRLQDFDAATLVRREELGASFAFKDAVEPANRLISLFRLLPADHLEVFPDQQLTQIKQAADAIFSQLNTILEFDPQEADAPTKKNQLVSQLESSYQNSFTSVFPLISFSVARTVDFNDLSQRGHAAVQEIRDGAADLLKEIKRTSENADAVLQEVRDAAAEQGVTQQAKYFSDEADKHKAASEIWLKASIWAGVVVVLYAVGTFFFPLFSVLTAESTSEAIQITVSKVLVFFVLALILFQCLRNYAAQKHNEVVNRHRQNALMTYTTLAEAGSAPEARDTVLQHAAAAIYAPNDTGFTKNEERGYGGNPIIGVTSRPGVGSGQAVDG